jgi:hypothetical protein
MDNQRPDRAIRGINRRLRREGQGECCGYSGFLCGSPCLCRLRTEWLVPMSKYWMYRSHVGVYGPSKTSILPPTDSWLKPTASMARLGEKLRQLPRATQPVWEVESGALFRRSSSIHLMLLMTHERLLYVDHVRYVCSRAIHSQSVESVWCVGRVFPAGCTSVRIVTTLRYE